MKKTSIIVVFAMLLAIILTACGSSSGDRGDFATVIDNRIINIKIIYKQGKHNHELGIV